MALYVRSLTIAEGQYLKQILRRGKNRTKIRQAQVMLMSDQGMRVQEIAAATFLHEEYVRYLIRQFNLHGLKLFDKRPRKKPGEGYSEEQKAEIAEIALSPPRLLGQPFSHWSLRKLAEYLVQTKVVQALSHEKLRRILKEKRIRLQRTKTWKESNDPRFEAKKKRLKRLYRHKPKKGHVVCFDQFGPMELRPVHGRTWALESEPDRLPATYRRSHGTRQLLAFYDVHEDILWGYVSKRKCWPDCLRALQRLRARYPMQERIYVVLDNFSPHRRREIRRWAKRNNMVFVWTPTNASWLNRIECQFTELKKFVFHNTYFQSHQELRIAIQRFLRYRNNRNKKRKLKQMSLTRH